MAPEKECYARLSRQAWKERCKAREKERERKERERRQGGKHDRKSGHLQDRDRVTSQPFIKEESRFHS